MKTALLHRHNQEVLDRINRLFERKKFRLVSQLMDHENGVFQFRGKKTYLLPTRNVEGLDLKVYRVSDTVTRVEISVLKNDLEVESQVYRDKEDRLIETVYKLF